MAFSSIDPAYLAQQYTQIERSSKDGVLKAQQTRFTTLLSSYQKLETSLGSMQDLLESFTKDKELLSNTASTSADTVLSVTAGSDAVAGNYEIFVQQLAQNHQMSLSFNSTDTLPADGQFELTVAGESFAVDLSALPANAGLTDLASAINNAADNSGVQATVMRSGTQSYLVLTSKESGAANAISMNFVPGADTSGADIGAAVTAATELKAAQDAIVKVGAQNPITVTSASNKLEDVIAGVTIDLKKMQAGTDQPVQISVQQDPKAVEDKLKKFVDSYNALVKQINADPSLKSDTMARSISSQMRQSFQKLYQGATLSSVGIEFDRNGVLSVNSEKMTQALAENPAKVEQMLVADNSLFSGIQDSLEPYTKRFGLMKDKQQTLQASLDMVTEKQKRHDYSMDLVYKRYLSQFTQMQVTIAQLESSMSQFG
ncbi:flagellar filament capping protein FliD [Rheinheimera tangshanensis]|jgi:flagellar hook-associated protein 2|uniref:Flagellar hook-associated protein 2 n=1 Tax=Rheinheimera tangshanensis TaxID=400153 RepID=A0A5C8M342_9GAMM|nr:flagellar filament capping protein FliD [Rheinheimera tangshanensis]TXK82092.1 LafB [Rheinheimera tangshanensis]GGM51997.1 lateral flagellar hook-associated protein 2 [Rheinheimera tangshanensis]